ncbi:MAG TPA: thiosulfate oxidation carrier protein SoxY [Gemmatimonadaceae bacterium]
MPTGDPSRRTFVRAGALALAGIVLGTRTGLGAAPPADAGPDDLPEPVKKVLRERFGDRTPKSGHVQLDVPEVAPDSREVPVFIETDLPVDAERWVKGIHIIVDHNPDIYLAGFTLSRALGAASIDTRIKMRRSSHVRAIVETSTGELWAASRFVYTTLNGCV